MNLPNFRHQLGFAILFVIAFGNMGFQSSKPPAPSTEFLFSIERGDIKRVKELIHSGIDVNEPVGGNTPLSLALCDKEISEILIKAGANVNAEQCGWVKGTTPLMIASQSCDSAIVKMLIDAGANLNAKNVDGETALFRAINRFDERIAEVLIEAGIDINSQNNFGNTALMVEVREGHLAMVKVLLKGKADVAIKNHRGKTALIIAKERGEDDLARLLDPNKTTSPNPPLINKDPAGEILDTTGTKGDSGDYKNPKSASSGGCDTERDFRKATWGMTRDEVLKVEQEAILSEMSRQFPGGNLIYDGKLGDEPVMIIYVFQPSGGGVSTTDVLVGGSYIYKNFKNYTKTYFTNLINTLSRTLTNKYGEPKGYSKQKYSGTRLAKSGGKAIDSISEWVTQSKVVSMVLTSAYYGNQVLGILGFQLDYYSSAYYQKLKEEEARDRIEQEIKEDTEQKSLSDNL